MGGAAPGPRTRETAEAAEAEAGETRVHALSSQHTRGEGIRKHACLSEEGEGGGGDVDERRRKARKAKTIQEEDR